MSRIILYPVRKWSKRSRSGPRRRRLAATMGQMYLSGDLKKLQDEWLNFMYSRVPKTEKHPAEAIEEEFIHFKNQHYPQADGIWKIFISNPLIGHSSVDSLTGGKVPADISLYKLVVTAIDRLLLTSARTWWNKNRKVKLHEAPKKWEFITKTSDAIDKSDIHPETLKAMEEQLRVMKGVDVPYKTKGMLELTIDYWEQIMEHHEKYPTKSFSELVDQFAPDFSGYDDSALVLAAQKESLLLFANVAPIIESIGLGSVYDVLEAALERAVWANAKHAVQYFEEKSSNESPARNEKPLTKDQETRVIQRQHKSNAPYDYPPVHRENEPHGYGDTGYGTRSTQHLPVGGFVYEGTVYELVK